MKFTKIKILILSFLILNQFSTSRNTKKSKAWPSKESNCDSISKLKDEESCDYFKDLMKEWLRNLNGDEWKTGLFMLKQFFPNQKKQIDSILLNDQTFQLEFSSLSKSYSCEQFEIFLREVAGWGIVGLKSPAQRFEEIVEANNNYVKKLREAASNFSAGFTMFKAIDDGKVLNMISVHALKGEKSSIIDTASEGGMNILNTVAFETSKAIVDNYLHSFNLKNNQDILRNKDFSSRNQILESKIGVKNDFGDGLVELNSICPILKAEENRLKEPLNKIIKSVKDEASIKKKNSVNNMLKSFKTDAAIMKKNKIKH